MSVFTLLNKTCTVQRPTFAKDSVSGFAKASYSSTTGIRCAVQIMKADEWPTREAGETWYNVYFTNPPSASLAAIQVTDRLSAIAGYSNTEFEVMSIGCDDVGRSSYIRVQARTITGKATR